MKPAKFALLLLLFVPMLGQSQKKPKKPAVPAVFAQARYVYVEALDGGEFDRGLNPADRIAIADVRDVIKAWGRYIITAERNQADLIFVVRKGRLAEADVHGGFGNSPDPQFPTAGQPSPQNRRQQNSPEFGAGAAVGPEDDLLQVCLFNANDGKRGSPIWFRSEPNGLDAPRVRLIVQFRDAVEKAYPALPQPATPGAQSKP